MTVMDADTPQTRLTDDQRTMVEANAALVPFFVLKWHRGATEDQIEEHIANGMFGLIRAVQLFDPTKGFKFSTYAQAWIRQSLQRGQAVAEGIGYRQTTNWNGGGSAQKTYEAWTPPVSLDRPVWDEGDQTLGDLLEAADDVEDDALRTMQAEQLQAALIRQCRDAVDIAAVEQITSGETFKDAAARVGVTGQALRMRREYLASRVRHPVNGCEPIA